jgi:hypothetical protein
MNARPLVALSLVSLLLPLTYLWMVVGAPILESHAFRQTQTAITAYWFVQEGFRLAYQMPVLGYPWSAPFEFPFFQAVVAAISTLLGAPLDATGRLVSFGLFLATILPARRILDTISGDRQAGWAFTALYVTTPLYFFWGSTFMIQSSALFLSTSSMLFGLRFAKSGSRKNLVFFFATGLAAALAKVTVFVPAAAALMAAVACTSISPDLRQVSPNKVAVHRCIGLVVVTLGVLLLSYGWVLFTDEVKAQNVLSASLTSSSLNSWNFGTLQQRIWILPVLLERLVIDSPGIAIGIAILLARLVSISRVRKAQIGVLCVAYLAHVFLFTNLNLVHDYYQTESLIYIIAAIALAVVPPGESGRHRASVPWIAAIMLINGAACLKPDSYFANGRESEDPKARRTIELASHVKQNTRENEALILYGYDWSSEVHYYAERKGIAVPQWAGVLSREDIYGLLGSMRIGALVVCPNSSMLDPVEAANLYLDHAVEYRMALSGGCHVFTAAAASS